MNEFGSLGILQTFIAVLAASVVYVSLWYILALRYKRIDLIDSAWGLGFIYVAALSLLLQPTYGTIQLVALSLVAIWGLRLSIHISARNIHKNEDRRYTSYRKRWGDQFTSKAYTNIYLVQGALIAIISTPIITIMNRPDVSFNYIILIGFIIWITGIMYESIADHQLREFLSKRKSHEIMQSGLWKYSRHPNYFGEIVCWWGAGVVAAGAGGWWGFVGSLVLTFVIVKISGLPPLERHYTKNSAYQAYKKSTPALIPLPRQALAKR